MRRFRRFILVKSNARVQQNCPANCKNSFHWTSPRAVPGQARTPLIILPPRKTRNGSERNSRRTKSPLDGGNCRGGETGLDAVGKAETPASEFFQMNSSREADSISFHEITQTLCLALLDCPSVLSIFRRSEPCAEIIAGRIAGPQQRDRGRRSDRHAAARANRNPGSQSHCFGGAEQVGEISAERSERELPRAFPDSRAVGHARASGFRRLVSRRKGNFTAAFRRERRHRRARHG